jgi:hypothetical protein
VDTGDAMHLVFVLPRANGLRNFESGLAALLDRGHRLTIAIESLQTKSSPIVERLQAHGHIRVVEAPPLSAPLAGLGLDIRRCLDYWHYLQHAFDSAPEVRLRASQKTPAFARLAARLPAALRAGLAYALHQVERRLPVPAGAAQFLERLAPDVVLLTPLIYFESHQVWWVRAAASRRIPTVFCVHSWDNLSSKGTFHEVPAGVFVWNEAQRQEAIALHGVNPALCTVTGATAFDHWFESRPAVSRQAFLTELGLDPAGPVILYLCSSRFIARRERRWIHKWIRALRRSSHERLRSANVIIRPHPEQYGDWRDWAPRPLVTVFPTDGENPIESESRLRYFHSLHHADVVVGLNSSSMIEASILGKPVLSIEQPIEAHLRKTLHFRHLEEGLLWVSRDVAEHLQQLAAALDGELSSDRSRHFVGEFVRPFGLDRPAGPVMANALEEQFGAAMRQRSKRPGRVMEATAKEQQIAP